MLARALGFVMLLFVLGTASAAQDAPPSDASIEALLQVMHARTTIDSVVGPIEEMMRQSTQRALAGQAVDAGKRKILEEQSKEMVDQINSQLSWSALEPMVIILYRDNYTQKEVDDMTTFYRTPSGQSMATKMPAVTMQMLQMMQTRSATLMPQLQQIVRNTASRLKAYDAAKAPAATAGDR